MLEADQAVLREPGAAPEVHRNNAFLGIGFPDGRGYIPEPFAALFRGIAALGIVFRIK